MMKRALLLVVAAALIAPVMVGISSGLAEDKRAMGMVTGSESGTYIQFGKQIAEIAAQEGIEIIVKTSGGSLDNVRRIRSTENAALGIVQSDVLGFIQKKSDDPELKQFVRHLRLIYPFYNEEVHLYASKEITDIKDLQGKRVAIGTENSGNFVTSMNLFHIMQIEPLEYVTGLEPMDAAAAVISGEVDAMIYVAGKPVSLFTELAKVKSNPDLAPYFENTHFVPLNHEAILKEYVASDISTSDYDWFEGHVPTVAVKAVLIGYDFSKGKSAYYKMRCNQLGELSQAIRDGIGDLRKNGHPKWAEVDLDQEIGIWTLDACSRNPPTRDEPPGKGLHEKIIDAIKSQ
jgi:TRAP transporter TAXI family solute receptor